MDAPQVVRVATERPQVDEWSLTLTAVGIEARADWSPQHGYLLLVAAEDAPRAHAVLDAYDDENRARPVPPAPPRYGSGDAAALLNYRRGAAQLCVSRSTGFWGPALRLFAPAEIVEVTVRNA